MVADQLAEAELAVEEQDHQTVQVVKLVPLEQLILEVALEDLLPIKLVVEELMLQQELQEDLV